MTRSSQPSGLLVLLFVLEEENPCGRFRRSVFVYRQKEHGALVIGSFDDSFSQSVYSLIEADNVDLSVVSMG